MEWRKWLAFGFVSAVLFLPESTGAYAPSSARVERLVKAGAATIQVFVAGQGPTVVLIPSLGRGIEDFDDLSHRLVDAGYRVVLPQPRGIGNTTGLSDHSTLHDSAADVAAVIRDVGGEPVTLIGHAHGNRVARMVATDHPRLVQQVVLLAAGGLVPMSADIQQALDRCFDDNLSKEEHLAAIAKVFFAKGHDPAVWDQGWHRRVMQAQRSEGRATPVESWWAAGTAPLLVLQASEDAAAPAGNAAALQKEYGNRVKVVEIPNAGHAMLPEQPELIATTIIAWLKR
jgi:pimeloyl-ACP methyl ester carboxylesterase